MKLLIWLIYPVVEAIIQAYLQRKYNWKPVYFQINGIRTFFAILYGGAVLQMPYDMVLWWSFVGWVMSTFFVVFDPLLQVFKFWKSEKKMPFGYTGKHSGWINELIGDSKGRYIAFYAFCVLLAIASFIVYNA